MDENKRKKLLEIKYKIQPCCGNCKHFFNIAHNIFGVCDKYTYNHLKHNESKRRLSVNEVGICESGHEWIDGFDSYQHMIGKFAEFIQND
jgi:hypothetical protein